HPADDLRRAGDEVSLRPRARAPVRHRGVRAARLLSLLSQFRDGAARIVSKRGDGAGTGLALSPSDDACVRWERTMLTRMVMPSGSRLWLGGGAALALWGAPATFERAQAGGAGAVSCVGSAGAVSCAGRWEWTGDGRRRPTEQEEAESAERHRKWVAR